MLYITDDYELAIKTTNDGGQTWNLSSNPPQHGIMQISYGDENTVYAVGYSSSIYKSTNGGDNWTLLDSHGTDINLGVYFKDGLNGVYAGEEGDLYVTHDGGTTWENNLYTAIIISTDSITKEAKYWRQEQMKICICLMETVKILN